MLSSIFEIDARMARGHEPSRCSASTVPVVNLVVGSEGMDHSVTINCRAPDEMNPLARPDIVSARGRPSAPPVLQAERITMSASKFIPMMSESAR